jgi:hypothetical protein
MAGRLHRAGEEARVEQVQDRVLDAADILVDRQPALATADSRRRRVRVAGGEAREIPGRIDEGVHRVGLAARRLAAFGQSTCFHVGCRSSGLPGLSNSRPQAASTGRSFAGTGRAPQSSQWITGIGQPQ